jgi:hypothetical protein
MNNPFYKLNQALEELGQTIAQLGIMLLVIILMLLPGAVFVFLMYGVFTGEKFSISECVELIFFSIASWYTGLGIKQIMSDQEKCNELIIHEYGKVLEKVAQETIQKYPAAVYPRSLLPYPKKIIEEALNKGLHYHTEEDQKLTIESGLAFLSGFIEDEEANKKNGKLLNNEDFQQAVKRLDKQDGEE